MGLNILGARRTRPPQMPMSTSVCFVRRASLVWNQSTGRRKPGILPLILMESATRTHYMRLPHRSFMRIFGRAENESSTLVLRCPSPIMLRHLELSIFRLLRGCQSCAMRLCPENAAAFDVSKLVISSFKSSVLILSRRSETPTCSQKAWRLETYRRTWTLSVIGLGHSSHQMHRNAHICRWPLRGYVAHAFAPSRVLYFN